MADAPASLPFSILGRPMRATGVPPALDDWLRARWYFPDPSPTRTPDPHPFTISIAAGAAPARPGGAGGTEHTARLVGMEVVWRETAGVWSAGTAEQGVRFSVRPEGSRIEVWGVERRAVSADLHAALYIAICESLRASGLLPLHAAVAARDGRATAFAGPSGVGKTSTLLRAIAAGWSPVAEDLAWLDPATRTVHGFDRGIRLWPDALAALGEYVRADGWRRDVDGKLLLDYAALGAPLVRSADCVRFALLAREPEGSEPASGWTPLAPREAVRALWEAVGVPLTAEARSVTTQGVAQLLRQVEFVRLRAGSIPPAV